MILIYDLINLLIALIYLPIYLFKGKFHSGFRARFGILPRDLSLDKPIWIHAVSVGEAMSIKGLVQGIRKLYPQKKLIFSTVTPTGNKIAKDISQKGDLVTYLPLDLSFIVRKTLNLIRPEIFIIAETEIWPNMISCLFKMNIPVIVVNARISDSSFKGYSRIKFLLKPVLNKVSLFCAQTELDAERLLSLGLHKDKVKVTGNMKFDIKDCTDPKKDFSDLKNKLGLGAKNKLFIAGSTHPGEEDIILRAYKDLLKEFPSLRLLIAPRHPERTTEINNIAQSFSFKPIPISSLEAKKNNTASDEVFILDTIGELVSYYNIGDIIFVGGSLIKKGGHNILEPAALGKPVIFGQHMFNFRDIADLFIKNKAGIVVNDLEQLKKSIAELLLDPIKADELSGRAKELILQNKGATERNLKLIQGQKI